MDSLTLQQLGHYVGGHRTAGRGGRRGTVFNPATGEVIAEYPTANGPADYALVYGGNVLGIVEAKKLTLSPQGVRPQAERYARGLPPGQFDFDGVRAPFLYSTNGEIIWYHDIRHPLNRSRTIAGSWPSKAVHIAVAVATR